jgi:hypothetical protein
VKKPVLDPIRSAGGTLVTRGGRWRRGRVSGSIIRITSACGSTTRA